MQQDDGGASSRGATVTGNYSKKSWAESSVPGSPQGALGRTLSSRVTDQDILRQLEVDSFKFKLGKEKLKKESSEDEEAGIWGAGSKIEDWTDQPPPEPLEREKIREHFLRALLDESFFLPPTLLEIFDKYTAAQAIADDSPHKVIVPPCEALECFIRIFATRWQHSAADPNDRKEIFPFSLLNRVLLYVIERETERVEDSTLLFRENTNTSKLLQSFFRLRGNEYLRETLSPAFREFSARDLRVEIGIPGQEKAEAEQSQKLLQSITSRIIDDIIASLKNVPAEIKVSPCINQLRLISKQFTDCL